MNLSNFVNDEIQTPYSIEQDKEVQIVDSFLSERDLSILQRKIMDSLLKKTKDDPQNLGYFHTSIGWSGSVNPHWSYVWPNDIFIQKKIVNKIQDTFNEKYEIERVYSVYQCYGNEGSWHVDNAEDINHVTCTIYLDMYNPDVLYCKEYIPNAPNLSIYDINNIYYFSYLHNLSVRLDEETKEKYNLINKQQLQYSTSYKITNHDNNLEKTVKIEKMKKMKKMLNNNDCGGYLKIKPPGSNHIISIPTITNRLCYFPAHYIHMGDSPTNITQKLRVCLSFKLIKI